ncbi:hypothetical protein M9458_046971, partial [Cirrhinus mrigala]
TANISSSSSSSALFGGGAFTPYSSPSPLVSPLFPSHQRNMQDEPAGLTASQSSDTNSEQSSAADNDLSRFSSAVGHAQTAGDLQHDRNIHQQAEPQQQQPHSSSSSTGLDTDAPSSKVKTQMESPSAHHINNGTGGNNMLAAAFPEMQNPGGGGSASPTLPAFGTPWSVQTSSPPPPVSNSANAINPIPTTEPDNFYPGIPSSINPGFFQSFSANPSPFSPQINSRRSPVSPQIPPQQGAFLQQRNNYNHHQVREPI